MCGLKYAENMRTLRLLFERFGRKEWEYMNFLVAWLVVGLTMFVFLGIVSLFENSAWAGGKSRPIGVAVRELLLGRRAS